MDSLKPINVLISLHKGYGLGDAVQMSSVLRHVRKYRSHWIIDFQAEEGRYCVGRGIVTNMFAYGQSYPSSHYDAEVQILLYDTFANWHDRPNTRVSSCLHEQFGLDWDAECGRYQVSVSYETEEKVKSLIPRRTVVIHYQGDSSCEKKNLSHEQAYSVCKHAVSLNRKALLLDWRDTSPISQSYGPMYSGEMLTTGHRGWWLANATNGWGGNAEMNCAVIAQCEAFVGIDSGPSKCASATDTPTLVVWTRHHPAVFHDPAPNTTHLVPVGYHGLEPVCGDSGVIQFFESRYNICMYEHDPVVEIKKWLAEVLR